MKLYRREAYLKKIRGFYHDTGLIKVITGVRRCGKSCLMETIVKELKESGTDDRQGDGIHGHRPAVNGLSHLPFRAHLQLQGVQTLQR